MSGYATTGANLSSPPVTFPNKQFYLSETTLAQDLGPQWSNEDDSNITVEELSDTESMNEFQILHPYELEEAESGSEGPGNNSVDIDIEVDDEEGEETQDSDSATTPQRLHRLRWHTPSQPVFASPSPSRSNKRKRIRSEETDTESDGAEGVRNEPPRLRRRIGGSSKITPSMSMGGKTLFGLNEPAWSPTRPAWVVDDAMDIDGQTAPAT